MTSDPAKAGGGGDLAAAAEQLRLAHHREAPLLLPNAWDVASARVVAAAGFPAVATSSRAVAQVLGVADDDSSDPEVIFDFIARIAGGVDVPVTADLEGGFQLPAADLVGKILAAGLAGCNLEDSDHHGSGTEALLPAERQAAYLAEVRAAAAARGVHVVLNARIDTFVRGSWEGPARIEETVRRAKLYLEAGADCVYPIMVADRADAAALVEAIPGPVNLIAHGTIDEARELAALGARRISFGSGIFTAVTKRHAEIVAALAP